MTDPMPPNGWNVMQLGQIGWHVVQSGDGWDISRLFGPEILSRPGEEGISDSDPSATLEGGRGAADAPTPLEQIVKAVLERAADAVRPSDDPYCDCKACHAAHTYAEGILALPVDQIAAELAHLWPGAIKEG